jgi:hypothetical protein
VSLPSSASPLNPATAPKPGTNVYTVMLIISFCALVTACALLAFELSRFGPGVPWAAGGGS